MLIPNSTFLLLDSIRAPLYESQIKINLIYLTLDLHFIVSKQF